MKIKLNKPLSAATFLFIALSINAQPAKWFITLSVGYELAGPSGSIKKSQIQNGYNVPSTFNIFSSAPRSFPYVSHGLSLLGTVGRKVTKRGSVYIMFGQPGNSEVRGYDGRFGNNIKYHVFQFTGGYQLSFSNSRCKIGAGPSLFILQSGKNNHYSGDNTLTDKHNTASVGLSFMGRVPLGSQRKLLGLELFGQLNAAPRTKFEDASHYYNRPETYNMNMIGGVIGLSLAIREKVKTEP